MSLEWNVWYGPWNRQVCKRNVFDHGGVMEDLRKAYRKCKRAKETDEAKAEFVKEVRRTLMYHYWSKCEWEIVISHWPSHIEDTDRFNRLSIKIDIWDQIEANWDHFIDYLWEKRKELK